MIFAEHTLDPKLSFAHSVPDGDDCKTSRETESLSGHIDVCNTILLSSMVSFAEYDVPVNYTVKVFKKENSVVGWPVNDVEVIAEFSQKRDTSFLAFIADNTSDYIYAAAACTPEGECPFKVELDINSINYPDSCSQ
jgi:hypothetical protein